ncbi:GNAT family N-acetyltransferase [Inhella gelatinilytica]|uniref:GNAT family N-acetyltransferase n=1 Tax=Inhella gelatinilytica TaxID=2795030 RepID=A0A931IZV4_9BURK|nr:GNAT family N-acetyltransferase [Inhella gelatinilytica]MBH9554174.1 GNAT family N-acetyltransferase [Inhella gelatinilytica]
MSTTSGLTIRRIAIGDASSIAAAFADPEMYSGTLQLPYPGEAGWRTRIEGMLAPGSSDHVLVAERDGQFVGMAGLHPAGASARRRHAMHLGITITATAQGQGVGKQLMAALIDLADNWLGVLRLELTVYSDNARAIALYERFGFVREGLFRGYGLRKGQYVDTLSMARWHPTPPRVPASLLQSV